MLKQKFKRSKLYPIYLKLAYAFGYRKKLIILTSGDLNLLVDEWTKILPSFDCIIGIPRLGLLIADRIALNKDLPLSTPENFLRGETWQSYSLEPITEFHCILIVDDKISEGRKLFAATIALKQAFPEIVFETGSLILDEPCNVDYYFIWNELKSFAWWSDVNKRYRYEFRRPT